MLEIVRACLHAFLFLDPEQAPTCSPTYSPTSPAASPAASPRLQIHRPRLAPPMTPAQPLQFHLVE
ncbi:MAG: hypothetical protein LQ350_005319 [Teloschistes chrysophthalmus]|nr:MAG: hypothetical protein LQ350_005319 [Niorma chrysophthalma]